MNVICLFHKVWRKLRGYWDLSNGKQVSGGKDIVDALTAATTKWKMLTVAVVCCMLSVGYRFLSKSNKKVEYGNVHGYTYKSSSSSSSVLMSVSVSALVLQNCEELISEQ